MPLAILGLPGGTEWIVILIVALLLFGKRLPEVMRSLGRGVVEFKKGVKGLEDEIEQSTDSRPSGTYVPSDEKSSLAPPPPTSEK